MLPQSSDGKRIPVLHVDIDRLLPSSFLLPLVEPVSRDQAPTALEGVPKHRLLGGSLGLRVDRLLHLGGVLHPGREQAPPMHGELAVGVVRQQPNHRHRLRGRDVVPWLERDDFGELELLGEAFNRRLQRVAPAHRNGYYALASFVRATTMPSLLLSPMT